MLSARKQSTRTTSVDNKTENVGFDFYKDPPQFELSLGEFEQYALSRLKVRYYAYIVLQCDEYYCTLSIMSV